MLVCLGAIATDARQEPVRACVQPAPFVNAVLPWGPMDTLKLTHTQHRPIGLHFSINDANPICTAFLLPLKVHKFVQLVSPLLLIFKSYGLQFLRFSRIVY